MHDVQLAPLVLAERGDPERRVDELGTRPRLPALNPVPDAARAVIAVEVAPEELRKAAAAIAVAPGDRAVVRQVAVLEDGQRQRAVVTAARRVVAVGPLDRKSTRLNSSHTVISYAVFCLKKKKK